MQGGCEPCILFYQVPRNIEKNPDCGENLEKTNFADFPLKMN